MLNFTISVYIFPNTSGHATASENRRKQPDLLHTKFLYSCDSIKRLKLQVRWHHQSKFKNCDGPEIDYSLSVESS